MQGNITVISVNISTATVSGRIDVNAMGLQPEIFGNVAVAGMTVVALYLLLSSIIYYYRSKTNCTAILVLHVCTGIITVCSLISEQLELQLGTKGDVYCFLYTLFTCSFYFLGLLSTFALLWCRQRTLYLSSVLKAYSGRCLNFVSKYIIAGICSIFLSAALLVCINVKLTSTERGCILQSEDEKDNAEHELDKLSVVIVTLVLFGVFFQTLLLALIVCPLKTTKFTNNESKTCANNCSRQTCSTNCRKNGELKNSACFKSSNENSSKSNGHNCIFSMSTNEKSSTFRKKNFSKSEQDMEKSFKATIRRLIICTVVCISSELIAGSIAIICLTFAPDSYWSLVIHGDLLINLFSVTFSFANWKDRLFPNAKFKQISSKNNKN